MRREIEMGDRDGRYRLERDMGVRYRRYRWAI